MGTPLPPLPPDPGDLCTTCWGDDGELGKVTSRVLSIQLFNLEEGAFWDESFRSELFTPTDLIQNSFSPCFFANVTGNFAWFIFFPPDGTVIEVYRNVFPERPAFEVSTVDLCKLSAPNDIISPDDVVAFNGSFSLYLGVP